MKELNWEFSIVVIATVMDFYSFKVESQSVVNDTIEFRHETCHLETCTVFDFETFFSLKQFQRPNGNVELFFKLKGVADGFIALTTNISNTETQPMYLIILGSYNNKISEIRRAKKSGVKRQLNTPGIISENQFRGFLITFNPTTGGLSVFNEGTDVPLMHWIDPNPLPIKFFSFATYHNRVLQVAFNCRAKDSHSSLTPTRKGTL